MNESYCGKSCADCGRREELNCEGCRLGPGRLYQSGCEIAACCKSKGHETCETCSFKENCRTWSNRMQMPEMRIRKSEEEAARLLRKREAEEKRRKELARKSQVLGKWLWILFWLIVPSTIADLMSMDSLATVAPGVHLAGQILLALCSLAYGMILLQLASIEDHYRTAGWCCVVAAALTTLAALFGNAGWTLVLSFPAGIVAMVGEYHEYTAHAEVLIGVDQELSEKWRNLWKWYIGTFAATFGSILVMLISVVLGALVLIAALIGLIVVSILKLVYLYRTAKLFREYRLSDTAF